MDGLEPEIAKAVHILRSAGVATQQSCQGGEGHLAPEPIVEFRGDFAEALRAGVDLHSHLLLRRPDYCKTRQDPRGTEPLCQAASVAQVRASATMHR